MIDFAVLSLFYSRAMAVGAQSRTEATEAAAARVHRGLLVKCLCVTAAMIGLFFAGRPIAIVALAAAPILLLDRVRPEKSIA